jgi:hypothetical protein
MGNRSIENGKRENINMKFNKSICLILAGGFLALDVSSDPKLTLHGYGWVQAGRIMNTSDTLDYNYSKNWMQSAATQITANMSFSDNLEGYLGIGGGQEHLMQGNATSARLVHIPFRDLHHASQLQMVFRR